MVLALSCTSSSPPLSSSLCLRSRLPVAAVPPASYRRCETTHGSREDRKIAKWQLARFLSAGGKMAYHWLGILPRQARHTIKPIAFPGHLFKIALQYRCGLKCVPTQSEGARCHCKCTKGGHRKLIDAYGMHLSTCPWGGWRIGKHDRVNEQYGRFCKGARQPPD